MIAIIEDDNSIRELVSYTLSNTGFEAVGFSRGSEFDAYFKESVPELLLLDVMLPEEDGISILKRLRRDEKTRKMPVIMLTARDSEFDKIIGLDTGADDYVTKPFGMMELVSRIKAVLRRTATEPSVEDSGFSHRDLRLDDSAHMVFVKDEQVELTLKEYKVLRLLLQNRGQVLSRDSLLQQVWGYDFDGETRTVDVHIRTLRSKLGDCGEYIETVRGVGYKIGGKI